MQKSWRIIILTLFSLWLAACTGNPSPTAEPAPTVAPPAEIPAPTETALPTVAITTTPEPTVAATATAEPTVAITTTAAPAVAGISLDAANAYGEPEVDSYRLSLRFTSTLTGADGSVTQGTILIEGARDRLNDAASFTATANGTADFGAGQQFSFTQIGGVSYFSLPNGTCQAMSGANPNSNLFSVFLDDGGVLGELTGAQPGDPPTATVNDVLTDHYVFDETNLDPADPTTPDVTAVNGDIYLAVDGGHVVRILMMGQGSSNLLNGIDGDGDIEYELNYFDFGVPVVIEAPAGCNQAGASGDYPMLADASNAATVAGVLTYTSAATMAEATAFYKDEMTAAGWSLAQEVGDPATGLALTFTNEGQTVQVTLTAQAGGVLIAIVELP
ncbi:MAG: hypothetical protein KDE28_17285 [Anaerolineales bacterium]|nr:hypothetical protein [Anaerolineales bacterium]MCB0029672.1 hypothetical protein [Anaerolineales bacterium]